MHPLSPRLPEAPASPTPNPAPLELRGVTYAARATVLPALVQAVTHCGCWVHERKAISLAVVELRFDMQLRAVVELYSALIAGGLELSRDSHFDLTGHCMLRKHNPMPAEIGRVLSVRLEITFLEDCDLPTLSPREAGYA